MPNPDEPVKLLSQAVMQKTPASEWLASAWDAKIGVLSLSEIYLASSDPMKPYETVFLRALADLLVSTLGPRIDRLSKALPVSPSALLLGLCLAGSPPTVRMPANKLHKVASSLVARLKSETSAEIREGILSLLVSDHVYHKCIWCDGSYAFSLGDSPDIMMIPKLYVETTGNPEFGVWADTRWGPHTRQNLADWRPFTGVCKKCHYNCLECGALGPPKFNLEFMQSLQADKLCIECGKKLLVNVKPPKPGRPELIALHRKRFLDL